MFYKAESLESIQLNNSASGDSYFQTDLVESMKYMFAYCSKLKQVDLSYFKTSNLVDMSFMFLECESLTDANLSNFDTTKVTTMEKMFYRCLNLIYINLQNAKEQNNVNMNNFLDYSLPNMVFCINETNTPKINRIINKKSNCSIIDCPENYLSQRKLLIQRKDSNEITCINPINDGTEERCGKKYFYYQYKCYQECPKGTEEDFDGKKFVVKEINNLLLALFKKLL